MQIGPSISKVLGPELPQAIPIAEILARSIDPQRVHANSLEISRYDVRPPPGISKSRYY